MTKKQAAKNPEQVNPLAFLGDWQAPEDHITEIPIPGIQWFNGRGNVFRKASPLLACGGFEFPQDVWGNIFAGQHEVIEVPHGMNDDTLVDGYILPTLHLSILAWRFIWEKQVSEGTHEYSFKYEDGYRGRINAFVLVKELASPAPALLTLHGTVTKHFRATNTSHLNHVLKTANKYHEGGGLPQYLFWVPVTVGARTKEGKKVENVITPPLPAWPEEAFTGDDLGLLASTMQDLYIGDYLREAIQDSLYQEAQDWATRWDNYMAENAKKGKQAPDKNGPTLHDIDDNGYLVIPSEPPGPVPRWQRWAESAMGLEKGEVGNLFAEFLRSNKHLGLDPVKKPELTWQAWAKYIDEAFRTANNLPLDEVMIEQMIQ